MHVTYAFVYYFLIMMVLLSIGLVVFAVRAIRKNFFAFVDKHKLSDNAYFTAAIYLAFAIIIIILGDSIMTYSSMRNSLEIGSKNMMLDNFDMIKKSQQEDYLLMYKKYREFYMAERNFMLTFSALFIYYVYQRFLFAIRKLVTIENQIEGKLVQRKKA